MNRIGDPETSAVGLRTATPLVGRRRELAYLEQALRDARSGAGQCVLLVGEAGIGKSRLVAEVRARAATQQFIVWQGYCAEQDTSFPFGPWIDALRAYLAPKSAAEIGRILGRFAPELVKLLPELSLLDPTLQPSPSLNAEAEKHRLFEALARFGASLAAEQPLLIVLEDVHWSDEQSLALLSSWARRIAALPILLLATYRGEEPGPRPLPLLTQLSREGLAAEVQLAALTRDEVAQLVHGSGGTQPPLTPGLLDELMRLTEGNPFFVGEVLQALPGPGGFESWRVPRSIQDAVLGRVKTLSGRTQQFLGLVAIMGERFDIGLAREVAGQNEDALLGMLRELIAAQVIVEQTADQFAFRHALTREAVYATLMQRERRALHQTIGETLERLSGPRTDAAMTQLAYHFYEAGDWPKAMRYAERAAELAVALYAMPEAVAHFTRVLEAAQQLGIPAPPSSLRGRAQAREITGDLDGAHADFTAVLDVARQSTDRVGEWQALVDLGFLWQGRDLERAGAYYEQALALAEELDDPAILAQTLNRVGNWHVNCARGWEALPYHRQALELFRRADDRRGMAQTMDLLGVTSYQLGDVVQGVAYLEQAVPVLRALDDRQGLVNILMNLSTRALFVTEVLGETNWAELTQLAEEAVQIARGFHWDLGEARALIPGALALGRAGNYTRALEWLERAQLLAEGFGTREPFARVHLVFGEIYLGLLALAEAQQHCETTLSLARELGSGLMVLGATTRLAATSILQHNLARAQDVLDGFTPDGYPDTPLTTPQRGVWSVRAELLLAQGNSPGALDIVDRLLATTVNLAQYGPQAVPYLSRLRGRALAALGRLAEAESEVRGAISVAQVQGEYPLLWRLQADLGRVYRTMGRRAEAERAFVAARTIIQDLADQVPEAALREHFLKHALNALPAVPPPTPRQFEKSQFAGLTSREREIAALIAQGKSNRDIAAALVISPKTAERHVANILAKLGFSTRTQIAVWATEKGLD